MPFLNNPYQESFLVKAKNRLFRTFLPNSAEATFHNPRYRLITRRRIELLESLPINFSNKKVLDVGSGIGDFAPFYLSQTEDVTLSDGRDFLVKKLRKKFPKLSVISLPLDPPRSISLEFEKWDIVCCFGVLYHLSDPFLALEYLSSLTKGVFILESIVDSKSNTDLTFISEPTKLLSSSITGIGCIPSREWVFNSLSKFFPFVYLPAFQPFHGAFPSNWEGMPVSHEKRCIFVASFEPLSSELLLEHLPAKQAKLTSSQI